MKALITGASSGIGRDMAVMLGNMGYDIYAVARRAERLEELKKEIKSDVHPICADLSREEECYRLYETVKDEGIDIFINNAGFGAFGKFCDIPLEREIDMINLNVKSMHILFKLFLNDFLKNNHGYIMNVASSAGFMMGPLLATYYATKSYVLRLTQAVAKEIKKDGKNVCVSALCPGPVNTEFDSVANVRFSLKGLSSKYVAKYAINKMFAGKTVIIPGTKMKLAIGFSHIVPDGILSEITYRCQHKKETK